MNLFNINVQEQNKPCVQIEDFMIRQNHRAFWIILICATYILSYQYFGNPMSCIPSKSQKLFHNSIPIVQQRFLDEFCYRTSRPILEEKMVHAILHDTLVNRTFEDKILPYLDPQLQKNTYYDGGDNGNGGNYILPMWKPFPFFLLLQAILFWLPRNFLTCLRGRIEFFMEFVDQKSINSFDVEDNTEYKKILDQIAEKICKCSRGFKHWIFLSHFILCQTFLLINTVIQLYLVHNIFFSSTTGKILPKAAKCLFPLNFGLDEEKSLNYSDPAGLLDGEGFQESLCIIFLNFHMEIVFRTIWAILWIILTISILSLTLDLINYFTGGYYFKMKILQRAGIEIPSATKRKINYSTVDTNTIKFLSSKQLSMADLFFMKKLAANLRPTIFRYLLRRIAENEGFYQLIV